MASEHKHHHHHHHHRRKKHTLRNILIAVLILLLAACGVFAFFFARFYSMTNFMTDEQVKQQIEEAAQDAAFDQTDEDADTPKTEEEIEEAIDDTGLTDDEAEALESVVTEQIKDIELPDNKDVYTILLVGVDRRDRSWSGNSDVMMLLSINKKQKKIHMISMMRDLYANIPGHGVRKLNAACAYGGSPLLVQTIEENYKVSIDNYASVDFYGMIDIVDSIGGIELEVSDAEAQAINNGVREMASRQGVDPEPHYLSKGGTYLCDGYQTTAYARIRYVGNADYQRTERQRTVMTKILAKVKGMSLSQLNDFMYAVLPNITHNIETKTMVSLLPQVPSMLNYPVEQDRVPYDGMFTSHAEILVPNDMSETISKLQNTLYG